VTLVTGLDILEIAPPDSEKMRYPYSFIALYPTQSADYIFKITLLGLLANGHLEVRRSKTYQSSKGGTFIPLSTGDIYTMIVRKGTESPLGELEHLILGAAKYWSPVGITVYELVRQVYERDRSNPNRWLIALVADNAVERRIGKWKGLLRQNFQPDPAHEAALIRENQKIDHWLMRLSHRNPEFLQFLERDISRGISSRQGSDNTISID
jgi:hypothetical protein